MLLDWELFLQAPFPAAHPWSPKQTSLSSFLFSRGVCGGSARPGLLTLQKTRCTRWMYLFFPLLKQISHPNALGQCLKYLLLKRFYKYFGVCVLISWFQVQAGQKCRRPCLGWSLSPAKKSFMGPLVLPAAPKAEIPTPQASCTGHGICIQGDLWMWNHSRVEGLWRCKARMNVLLI